LFVLAWELLALLSEQEEEEEEEEEAKGEEATSLLLVVVQLVSVWVPGQFVSLLVLALFREPLTSLAEKKKVEVPSLAQVPEPSASPIVQVLPPELLSSLSALSA
jgi:hypothetical protein